MENEEYTPYGEEWLKEMSKLPKSAILTMFQNVGKERDLAKDAYSELGSSYSHLLLRYKELEFQQKELIEVFEKQIKSEKYDNPELNTLVGKLKLRNLKFSFNIYEEPKEPKEND